MATKKTTKKTATKKATKKAATTVSKKAATKKTATTVSKKAATKKAAAPQKAVAVVSKKKKTITFDALPSGKYNYAVGRRKSAVAQVRIYAKTDATDADFIVNGKAMTSYFPTSNEHDTFLEPLRVSGSEGKVAITVVVRGGGLSGQAQATRLGIARALTKMDDGLRPILKANGLLTRDARVVERKKPGLRKARRSPQWSKR